MKGHNFITVFVAMFLLVDTTTTTILTIGIKSAVVEQVYEEA